MNYIKVSERSPPNLTWLRKRVESFGYYLDEQNLGSAPFRFGVYGDFWANMQEEVKPYQRRDYFEERTELFEKISGGYYKQIANFISPIINTHIEKKFEDKKLADEAELQ